MRKSSQKYKIVILVLIGRGLYLDSVSCLEFIIYGETNELIIHL